MDLKVSVQMVKDIINLVFVPPTWIKERCLLVVPRCPLERCLVNCNGVPVSFESLDVLGMGGYVEVLAPGITQR